MYSKVLQDKYGQIEPSYSIAAGLDYPGVGPELAYLTEAGRVNVSTVTDDEAVRAFRILSECEGIIPALESAHAVAYAIKSAKDFKNNILIINLSGRGDKDVEVVAKKTRLME